MPHFSMVFKDIILLLIEVCDLTLNILETVQDTNFSLKILPYPTGGVTAFDFYKIFVC